MKAGALRKDFGLRAHSGIHPMYLRTRNFAEMHKPKMDIRGSGDLEPQGSDWVQLRNVLYCYHFMDTQDRGCISVADAMDCIRQIADSNHELFGLLSDVLSVVKKAQSGGHITKEGFIKRCEYALAEPGPYDASALKLLRLEYNPISEYFRQLRKQTVSGENDDTSLPWLPITAERTGHHLHHLNLEHDYNRGGSTRSGPAHHESINDTPRSYTDTPTPKVNKVRTPRKGVNYATLLKRETEEIHRFKTGNRITAGLNEYVVFHFNQGIDWSSTLRSLPSKVALCVSGYTLYSALNSGIERESPRSCRIKKGAPKMHGFRMIVPRVA